ncbi:alpha-1,3-galactosidase-related protein [Reichenbachiella faecimaris]|nr:hypothetical protein [Reichenbachiella faecimaris]
MFRLLKFNFLVVLFCIGCTSQQNDIIKLNPGLSDDFSVFLKDKLAAVKNGTVKLEFEKGTYHFYPENATEKYLAISNNDNGDKKIAFPFFDYSSIEVNGNGSDFIFHGGIVPFVLFGLGEAQLKNFNIYWDRPFTFEGEVMENDPINNTFTLKVSEENDYEIIGDQLYFKGYDWKLKLGENIVYEKMSKRPSYYTSKFEHAWYSNPLTAVEKSPGVVEFSNYKAQELPPVGFIWVDKGPHGQNRKYPGLSIQNSKNVHLENINVYASGAMALIAEKSADISLKKFNVTLPKGSTRMIGASADATHFVGCRGLIKIDSCLFENMLDDASNVHGTYMKVDEVVDSKTVKSSFGHFQQEGFTFASEGDTLRFVARTDLLSIREVTVKSVRMDSENDYKISLNEDISDLKLENTVLENLSYLASAKITNSIVRQNRARSLLISTPKPVEITNNYFSSMMAGIRICGDANYWFESGPVTNVLVKGNTFEDLGIGGHNPQAILQVDPIIGKDYRSNGFFHKNIVFTDNTIKTFDRLLVYGLSIDTLTITDNKIIQTSLFEAIYPDLSHFDIQNCTNVFISGNTYKGLGEAEISLKNCGEVKIDKQIGFNDVVMENSNKYFYQN